MSYGDYGLDETKVSSDGPGDKGKKYCLWCAGYVKTGFSMCFSNFVLCEKCAMSATEVVNNPRWYLVSQCDKCYTKDAIAIRSHNSIIMEWWICKSCVDWAKSFTKNRVKPRIINKKQIMDANFKKVIEAHLQELAAKDALFAETLKKPAKNIGDCCTYIINQVKAKGGNFFQDAEIFGMAVHYYDEDDINVGKPVSGVSVGKTDRPVSAKTATTAPPAKKEKKEVKVYASLFDANETED